jgi:hypothetical protein
MGWETSKGSYAYSCLFRRTMRNLHFLASSLLLILFMNSGLTLASSAADPAFDPLAFRRYWQVANCPGVNRAENKTVDLELRMPPQSHTYSGAAPNLFLVWQTMLISTRTRNVRSCSCMGGRVSGQAGNIRYKSLAYVMLPVARFAILSCGFQKDYRLIVPDIRGFGPSTHPGDVQSSGSMPDLVGDMLCILEHASISQAIVIGQAVFSHDFVSVD